MISRTRYGLAELLLAALFGLSPVSAYAQARSAPPASLQEVPLQASPKTSPWPETGDAPLQAGESPESEKQTDAKPETADISNLDIDWSQLDVDASTLTGTGAESKLRLLQGAASSGDTRWSSQPKPNGSAVSVRQPISPFLDTQVGADMTVVRQPQTLAELLAEKAENGGNEPQSSGTAWASISAPGAGSIWDKTAVEARLDPSQDQGKLGTSLSKSLKFSDQYLLTLQNGYSMVQQGPAPVPGMAGRTMRSYETDQSAKLSFEQSGTSFSAGQSLSTADEKWLHKIGAEQKIIGGFSISGAVSETPSGIANKSITAGFKQNW